MNNLYVILCYINIFCFSFIKYCYKLLFKNSFKYQDGFDVCLKYIIFVFVVLLVMYNENNKLCFIISVRFIFCVIYIYL